MTWRDAAVVAVVAFTLLVLLANPVLLWHQNRLVDKYEALLREDKES